MKKDLKQFLIFFLLCFIVLIHIYLIHTIVLNNLKKIPAFPACDGSTSCHEGVHGFTVHRTLTVCGTGEAPLS